MLSDELQLAIAKMSLIIHNNSAHDLLPIQRLEFYRLIFNNSAETFAFTFIKWLGFISATKIKSIWSQSLPGNDLVPRILIVAEGLINGYLTLSDTADERELFYNAVGGIDDEIEPRLRAIIEAAYLSLSIISDFKSLYNNTSEVERGLPDEILISLGGFDVENLAVIAYSGFNYDLEYADNENAMITHFDSQKRLEFWEWWLTETIPQAWKIAQETYKDNS